MFRRAALGLARRRAASKRLEACGWPRGRSAGWKNAGRAGRWDRLKHILRLDVAVLGRGGTSNEQGKLGVLLNCSRRATVNEFGARKVENGWRELEGAIIFDMGDIAEVAVASLFPYSLGLVGANDEEVDGRGVGDTVGGISVELDEAWATDCGGQAERDTGALRKTAAHAARCDCASSSREEKEGDEEEECCGFSERGHSGA